MRHDEPEGVEELALIQRAANGDHEAFRQLVVAYEPRLLAYLTQMLGDPESARDIAQETFIAVFHALPRWQLSAPANSFNYQGNLFADQPIENENIIGNESSTAHPLAPWLYRIATNHALSLIRKQTVRLKVHIQQPDTAAWQKSAIGHAEPVARGEASLEDRYVARELLQRALSRLSGADAACLVLHFVEGERYGEIATRLGLTSEAVRKRVARALTTLRQVYAAMDTEGM